MSAETEAWLRVEPGRRTCIRLSVAALCSALCADERAQAKVLVKLACARLYCRPKHAHYRRQSRRGRNPCRARSSRHRSYLFGGSEGRRDLKILTLQRRSYRRRAFTACIARIRRFSAAAWHHSACNTHMLARALPQRTRPRSRRM